MTNHRLLIVASDAKVNPSDAELKKLLYSLLDIKDPKNFFDKAMRNAKYNLTSLASSLDLATQMRTMFHESKPSLDAVKSIFGSSVHAESAFLYLLKQLYHTDLPRILPGSIIVDPGDIRLKTFRCSDGYFIANVVYTKHPADNNYYLPIANFHSRLEREKLSEMFALFDALGAKDYRVFSSDERDQQSKASGKVEDPTNISNVNASIESKSLSNQSYAFKSTSTAPGGPPTLPAYLKWFYQEEEWKRLAEARLNNLNKQIYSVQFTYEEDFGINAELNITVSGLGLSAGGSFSKIKKTRLTYVVEFFTSQDYEKEGFNSNDIQKSLASAKQKIFTHL
jgi:hypothetical protein